MPVTVESLVQPEGPVDPSFFPDDSEAEFETRLGTYITRATTKVASYDGVDDDSEDLAVQNWALYLTFTDAHSLMLARPASETFVTGLGGQGFNTEQFKAFERKAAYYKAAFDAIVDIVPTERPGYNVSRATTNTFEW